MDCEDVINKLSKHLFQECSNNEIIYGIFALNEDIPQHIRAMRYQPERSKREDSCEDGRHEYGSEENCDSADPFYVCNKCRHEMRCSEHCGNTVRDK